MRPAFGKEPLYTLLQAQQGVRFIIVAIRFPISIKNFDNKWSGIAAGKSKTSTTLPLLIDDKYR